MKTTIVFLLFFIPQFGFSQQARNQIRELHSGMLLVRLHTDQKKTEAMERVGMHKDAEKHKARIVKMNQNLITAFRKYFTFCPVYFFYTEKSEAIKNKELSGNILDSTLHVIDTASLAGRPFYIAEISKTESDTLILTDNFNYQFKDSTKLETRKTYYENDNIHYLALLIRSDQFIQLQKPFPAYINFRMLEEMPNEKRINRAMIKLNDALEIFYQENK